MKTYKIKVMPSAGRGEREFTVRGKNRKDAMLAACLVGPPFLPANIFNKGHASCRLKKTLKDSIESLGKANRRAANKLREFN